MPIYPYFFLLTTLIGWLAGLFAGPIYALLVYVFVYFNIPASQWWGGYVPDLRWSFSTAIVLVLSVFLHKDKGINNSLLKGLGTRLLVMYLALMLLTVPIAANMELSFDRVYDFFRYVVIFGLIVAVVNSYEKLRAYLWMLMIQIAWLSWSARSYFHGERLDGVGPGDAGDANGLAVLVISAIPFLLVFLLRGRKWERILALLLLPIVMNCFAMTRSRGGFLGLVVALIVFFLLEKDNKIRLQLMALSLAAMVLMFVLADQSFKDRLLGLANQDLQSESAGSGRVGGWRHGIKMVFDYPLGAGGGGYQYLSPQYLPEELLEQHVGSRAAHNTLLLVLVEQGLIGLGLFFLFYWQVFRITLRTKKKLRFQLKPKSDPANEQLQLPFMFCNSVVSALAGIFVAGLFTDRLYYEGFYLFCAIGPVLYLLSQNSLKDISKLPSE